MNGLNDRAESLADKMNKLTSKFDLAEDLLLDSDDIIDGIVEKTQDIKLYESDTNVLVGQIISEADVINLNQMTEDFRYARDTLKENADNGRRVLNSVTLELLDSDDDKRAALILSFAELNKAVTDNIKLYMQSWKEMSTILLNIDKIKKNMKAEGPKTVNNTVNIGAEAINPVDLIKKLKGE